jgi:hypothetical protein
VQCHGARLIKNQADCGSLSALMLSRMQMSVNEALKQYTTVGNGVFAQRRSDYITLHGYLKPMYDSKKMVRVLKQIVECGSKNESIRTGRSEIMMQNENKYACQT